MNNKRNSRNSLIDKVKADNQTNPKSSADANQRLKNARASLSQKVQEDLAKSSASASTNATKPKQTSSSSSVNNAQRQASSQASRPTSSQPQRPSSSAYQRPTSQVNKPLQPRSTDELNKVAKPSTNEIAAKLRSQQVNKIKPTTAQEEPKVVVDRDKLASTVQQTSNIPYQDEELEVNYDYVPEPIPQVDGGGNNNNDDDIPKKFKNRFLNRMWYYFFGTKIETKPLRYFDYFLRASFALGILGFMFAAFLIITSPHQFTKELIYRPNDTMVYDKNKKLIGKIIQKREDGANVENVQYKDLNQGIINSVVATEDSSYFTHHGFDLVNTVESFVKTLVLRSSSGGGSSITQQIIGQTHVGRIGNSSVARKVREIFLSGIAETQLDKSTILTSYLNYFDFGQGNVRGVELASKYFYDHNVRSNDYVQNSILVGTLNAPTAYNPLGGYINDEYVNYSQKRLENVLLANKNQGYLGDAEYYLLQQTKVENVVDINKSVVSANPYQDYIDVVAQELEDKYKVDPYTKSLKVYTTMDRKAQKYAHELTTKKHVYVPDNTLNFGFMVTKTQTGEIVALSGGKQYRKGGASLFNNATQNTQQPGSAFKPILDYAPTFEFLHWSDRTPISNAPYTYDNGMKVQNVDGTSGGVLTMDRAIGISRNLTALRAMDAVIDKIGANKLKDWVNSLGFELDAVHQAYALGGLNKGVTPKQMNGAYQAFGNGGYYIEPYTITSYTDEYDKNEIKNTSKKERVMDERTAFLTSTTLERSTKVSGAYISTANYYKSPYAAKTGTSNWDENGAKYGIPNLAPKDTWFAGYTTEYTMSSWGGYDAKEIKKGKYPDFGSGAHDYSAKLWGAMMNKLATGKEKSWLEMTPPKGIVSASFDASTPPPYRLGSTTGYFFEDNLPSGYSNNIDLDDLSVDLEASNKKVTATFSDKPDGFEGVLVANGSEKTTDNNSLSVKVQDYDTVEAYILGNGKKYGSISMCYYDGQLYNECPAQEQEEQDNEDNSNNQNQPAQSNEAKPSQNQNNNSNKNDEKDED